MQLSWRETGKLGKLTSSPFCHNHMPWHQFPLCLSRIFFIVQSFRTCSFRLNPAKKRVIGLLRWWQTRSLERAMKRNLYRLLTWSAAFHHSPNLNTCNCIYGDSLEISGNFRNDLDSVLYKDNKEREGVENFCHIICLPLGRKVSPILLQKQFRHHWKKSFGKF